MTKSTIARERLEQLADNNTICKVSWDERIELAQIALAAMDSKPERNPVLAYADSYRDMAKQGVESVPIWSVITDLERNIAPLYRHAQQPVVPDEKPMPNPLSMYAVDAVAAIAEVKGWNACRAAMFAAAPQSPGSEPATVPGKWIPVSERMPDDNSDVLCTAEFDGPGDWRRKVGYWHEGKWVVYGASWTPTHWMPLPAGPKGVKGE
ncbi:DUF551 domain-containing protein [Klebsiella variicola]